MALTGLQIQKLLPKTNCKECGSNTCLAFAMKLASKKAELSQCPYVSEEAKKILGATVEPPIRCIELGAEGGLKIGGETVLYRHEKTFVHQTLLGVNVNDTDSQEQIEAVLKAVSSYTLERVGEKLRLDVVCVTQKAADHSNFVALCKKAWEDTKKPVVLHSSDVRAIAVAAAAVKGSGSVMASATPETVDQLWPIAKENGHSLALTAPNLNDLFFLSKKVRDTGFSNILLQFNTYSLAERLQTNLIVRTSALRDENKTIGYPFIYIAGETGNLFDICGAAINEICKYGGICILPFFDPALISALITLRLNIFTDPQKPIQVEPRVYSIGEPSPDSPVFVTTNFSLTYFIISGEIENCGISAWLVVPECEGMSVLTAWAAGKFSGATIAKFVKETGFENTVRNREIIIPGYVAQISGELEENLSGWKVTVGPQEASDLENFIKARLK